jgi:secondary thiamine-phosphate synthase enzyme
MKTKTQKISVTTQKQFELIDITSEVKAAVSSSGVEEGIVTVYVPHTTASIRLNHNEPLLMQDIMKMLYRTAPVDIAYSHDLFESRSKVEPNERSNGHAHVKAFLLGSSETIPIQKGSMQMGEKQSIFLVELDGGRPRTIVIQVLGE